MCRTHRVSRPTCFACYPDHRDHLDGKVRACEGCYPARPVRAQLRATDGLAARELQIALGNAKKFRIPGLTFEDMAQEVLAAWFTVPDRHAAENWEALMETVAKNKLRDLYKAATTPTTKQDLDTRTGEMHDTPTRIARFTSLPPGTRTEPTALDQLIRQEETEKAQTWLFALTDRQRDILLLSLEEFTTAQIADRLGVTPRTIRREIETIKTSHRHIDDIAADLAQIVGRPTADIREQINRILGVLQ